MPHSATGRPEGQIRQFRAFRFGDVPLSGTSRRALLPAALSPLTAAHAAAAIHAAHPLATTHALTTHTLATHATLTITAVVATVMVMAAAATVIVRAVTGGQRQGQADSESQSKNLFHKMLHQQCFGAEDAR
ncbi:hypothetical protein AD934_07105 [Gluconobacter oxydans]|uniref:Uncharacterized protein n=1 Tax=Gluconobacter oxydans TaxID=442 RepID=A0A149RWD1_GLUOY|nr:hypothetical protein AD934_07105 [Gluconobacter oxydans]